MNKIVEAIMGAVKEGLSLWRTHLEKKVEIYELSLKKNKNKALNVAEDAFEVVEDIFIWIYDNVEIGDKKKTSQYGKLKERYYKFKKKFNDLD